MFIRHQRVEHLKINLEVQMINIDIKADDIFMGTNVHKRHSKQSRLPDFKFFSWGSNKVEVTLPLALSYDSNFMAQTKVNNE